MKIGIVGAGMVGSAAAYAMVMRGIGSEIVLVDKNRALAEAQAQDIVHATPFAYATRVSAGDFPDLAGAGVVMISAGVGQKPGESRLSLLGRNVDIFSQLIPAILKEAPDTILLVASNPVDVMTHVTAKLSGLPARRVIGSGTILDTARFRSLLADHIGISAKSVHAYVLGEHGDSEVLCWSSARSGSISVGALADQVRRPLDDKARAQIDAGVRGAAYRIIEGKGATWYGIGGGIARIVQAVASDENAILTVSALENEVAGTSDIAFSLPRIVGAGGAVVTLVPSFSESEEVDLARSAEILKQAVEETGL
ncbi:MAG: L-lactate dehydrogenase [Rhodospirillales bacterium]|nr:L-lactate dehydrogenase [Rhodospirillales bacterium]